MHNPIHSMIRISVLLFLGICWLGGQAAFSQTVMEAEYFWDSDPGVGNAIPLSASDGNFDEAIEAAFANSVTLPSAGNHTFNVRLKDALNAWGPVYTTVVAIASSPTQMIPQLTEAEYFWDTDPGQGNGIPLLAFDGNFNEAFEVVFANNLSLPASGNHTFNIRIRDSLNTWGVTFTTVISIETLASASLPALSEAEYFWNTDPGPGNGTPLIAFDGNFNESVEQVLGSNIALPGLGSQRFSVRIRDSLSTWGPTFSTVVSVIDTSFVDLPGLSTAEYFWDNDPGQGLATPLLAFDGNFDEALEQLLVAPNLPSAIGPHTFNARTRDDNGQWSSLFTTVVSVVDTAFASDRITLAGEVFWDVDPGVGNGIPLFAADGNFEEALETLVDSLQTFSLSLGPHTLNVRHRDAENIWGSTFTTVVWVDTSLVPVLNQINGPLVFCASQGLSGIGYSTLPTPGETYNWSVTGGVIVAGQGTDSVTVDWFPTGPYSISVQGCNVNGCGNVYDVPVMIQPSNNPVVTTVGSTTACAGDSVQLVAGGGLGLNIQWLLNGSPLSGATDSTLSATTSGLYRVVFDAGASCSDTSVATSVMILPPLNAAIASNGSPTICGNDSLELTAPNSSGLDLQWLLNGSPLTGATNPNYFATSSGNYQVVFSDPPNCPDTSAVLAVNVLPAISASITANGPTIVCNGGTASLQVSSPGSLDIQWLLNGIPLTGGTNSNLTAPNSGSYQAILSNAGVCPDTSNAISVSILSPLLVNAGPNQSLCFGVDSVALGGSPSASGSQGTYTYSWTGAGLSNPSIANPMAGPGSGGTYVLTVTDSAGCQAADSSTVTVNPQIFAEAGGDTVLCPGETVSLGGNPTASGGSGGFSYSWTPATGLSGTNLPNPVASPLAANVYLLTVQDAAGCQMTDSVVINLNPALFANAGEDSAVCVNGALILGSTPSASGGFGAYVYAWSPTTGLSNPTSGNPIATVSGNQVYSLTVTDGNNCTATDQIQITGLPLPVSGFFFAANQGTINLTDISLGSDSVSWDFGDSNGSSQSNPTHTYTASGTYIICQTAYNDCGSDSTCQSVQIVIIGVENPLTAEPVVYPNPNQGLFHIDSKGMEIETIRLYDNYGKLVFSQEGNWPADSQIEVTLPPLPTAVYYLMLQGKGNLVSRSLLIEPLK